MKETPPAELVREVVDRLTALTGRPPEVLDETGAIRVVSDVSRVPDDSWPCLLSVLEAGDTYGLNTTATGRTAWLRITGKRD
ncbi:hypothetical protein ACFYW1_00335 [Streptomyces sp. NPDC002669]|uniref:hypothetical protein n=1 Tax=Streptomyces sp. NPDC002669 TaxID=3364658 RepID=UPI0036B527AF